MNHIKYPISIYVRHALTVLGIHLEQRIPITRMVSLTRQQTRWFLSRKSRKRKEALRVVARTYLGKSAQSTDTV